MPQENKKIAMYFGKKRSGKDPFSNFGEKRDVYHYFFKKGASMGFDMFLVSGRDSYLGDLSFKNPAFFNGEFFVKKDGSIQMDAIYDRSGGTQFPSRKIDDRVLNNSSFKKLCWNKDIMYSYLKEFCPKSYAITSHKLLKQKLNHFAKDPLVVLKPAQGLKGKDVFIKSPTEMTKLKNIDFSQKWILQKFVDTSQEKSEMIKGAHDLRVVVANGKFTFSHVRQPQKKHAVANVASGGKLKELPLKKLPKKVLIMAKKIKDKIDIDFDKPIYSIDFGIENGQPFVFEINDIIGFPSKRMAGYKKFVEEILTSLLIRSKK